MDKKNALMILSRFKENLGKSIRINGLILFGSCGSDTGTEDSDIDVIVFCLKILPIKIFGSA